MGFPLLLLTMLVMYINFARCNNNIGQICDKIKINWRMLWINTKK